jgi:hypothetical protein
MFMRHRSNPARLAAGLLTLALAAGCSRDGDAPEVVAAADSGSTVDRWCAPLNQPNALCSSIPHDVNDTLRVGYAELQDTTQKPFDIFSWQSFVALNWPADDSGQPLSVSSPGDSAGAPRVWQSYVTPQSVFGGSSISGCGGEGRLLLSLMAKNAQGLGGGAILEATGQPLIDRNLNFAMYDIRVNPEWVTYVDTAGLTTAQGQAGKEVNFTQGYYANKDSLTGGTVGAIEIKAVWRILDPASGDDTTRFYAQPAAIYVPAQNSSTGSAMCIDSVTVGLVAMHIIHKTSSQPGWVWSSFEHVELAPTCTSTSSACGDTAVRYSFFDASCSSGTCPWNTPPSLAQGDTTYLWAATAPYAAKYAIGGHGTQAVRTQAIYAPTDTTTAEWRAKLAGTVWANYRLIGSQWLNPEVPGAGIPQVLGNSALETYIPDESSCVGCHKSATDAAGEFADFSFLLAMADSAPTTYFRAVRPAASGRTTTTPPAPRDTGRADTTKSGTRRR